MLASAAMGNCYDSKTRAQLHYNLAVRVHVAAVLPCGVRVGGTMLCSCWARTAPSTRAATYGVACTPAQGCYVSGG